MREITADCGSVPQIGIRHENGRTVARISLKSIMDMVESHPGGSYTLAYRRRLDDQFYVSDDFTVADGYLEWTVGSHALAVAGDVTVQVSYATGSITAETPQMRFTVGKSIFNGENGQGENLSDLVEAAITAAGGISEALNEAREELDAKVTAAETAQDAAETAQTAAERAQHTAENAKTSAAKSSNAAYNFAADANRAKRDATTAKDDAVQAKTDAENAQEAAETAEDNANTSALQSEGYAVGTQNGTPAGSGEPYYQDNAKYYKEQAAAAKTAAEVARDTAQQTVAGIETAGTAQVQRVTAEGATQVGNVQTKGQQVLDSIPDDYSELSGEVIELKSAYKQDININSKAFSLFSSDMELVYDSYSVPKSNGTFYTSSSEIWKATDYIACENYSKIAYSGVSLGANNICPIAFYDSNKAFISAENNSTSGAHNVSGIVDVPTNAAFFKMSRYKNPADSGFPASTNYCLVMLKTGSLYNVPDGINRAFSLPKQAWFFIGSLDVDTSNNSNYIIKRVGENKTCILSDGSHITADITKGETITIPSWNNFFIAINKNTLKLVAFSTTTNISDYYILGFYMLGYIYYNVGTITVNGNIKNKDIETAIGSVSIAQVETNRQNILSLVSTTNALNSDLVFEQNARETADNTLSARIDNLVAPTGESVAEIADARVGINGTIYPTLENRLNTEFGALFGKIGNVRTVGVGKDYTTIAAAVNAAVAGDIILISDGVYTERVTCRDKAIAIIGMSRDGVIWKYQNDNYGRPPLEMGKGVLKNVTLYATEVENVTPAAYALHCDFQGSGVIGGYLYCDNVKFVNDNYRAVGLGLRGNAHIEFHDCMFICSRDSEALYMHDANDLNYDIGNQSVAFIGCTFENNSSTKATIEVVSMERRSDVANITWQKNIVYNASTGGALKMSLSSQTSPIDRNAWLGSSDWVLTAVSALNTVSDMNY